MSTIKVDTIATRTGSGNITSSNTIDLNGNELILDVDGDTSLTADTDDQIDIRIGGTDVGTLTQNSGKLTINSSGTNLSFAVGGTVELNTDGTQFYPQTDNSHNLGTASLRFKDLYLSSGVFLGGTGAANELTDYEEGTWTPNIGGSGVGYGTQFGVYRKIGSMVYVYCQISINTIGSPATTNSIMGMPFSTTSVSNQYFGVAYYNGINNNTYEFHGNFRSDASIRMEGKTSFGTGQASAHNWAKNGASIYGSGWFFTA